MPRGDNVLRQNAGIILSAVLVFAAFGFGVFFSGFNKPHFAPALVAVVLVAVIALAPGFRRGWSFPANAATGFLLLFWWWLGFSLIWSQVPNVSMIFCLTIGAMPVLFFALTQSPRASEFIAAGRIAIIAAVSLLSLWAMVQFIFLSDMIGVRVHHPMLNPNNLAVTIVLGVFLLLPFFSVRRGWAHGLAGVLIVLIIAAVLTTQSRGGTLGLLVGLAVYAVVCRDVIVARWRSFSALLAGILVACIVFIPVIHARSSGLRLLGDLDASASTEARFYTWTSGLAMLRDHLFGVGGLGTFYLTFPPYRAVEDFSDGFFLHLDPVQFGIETGLPGMLFFYAFGAAVLVLTIKAIMARSQNVPARVEMICGFAGLLGLLLNSHIDYDLYMLPAQMAAALLLASWFLGNEQILGPSRLKLTLSNKTHRVFLIPAFALVLLAGPIWIIRAGVAVQYGGMAGDALAIDDAAAASVYSAKTLRWGPENYDRAYYMEALWRTRILQKNFNALDAGDRARLFDESLAAIDQALHYNPYNVQALNHKAILYFVAYPRLDPDGLDHARDALEQAFALDPVNFELRIGLSKVLEAQGNTERSVFILEDGLRYETTKRFAPALYFIILSEGQKKLGRDNDAAATAQKAVARNQEWLDSVNGKPLLEQWLATKTSGLLER